MGAKLHLTAPPTLELGPLRIHTPVILAPMAGVTDAPFRKLCREFGEAPLRAALPQLLDNARPGIDGPSGLYVAEMVTARALLEHNQKSWRMVEPDPEERIKSVQLYGTEPSSLGVAAGMLVERGLADHIDLNFGCPVPKVTRKGGGAAIPWKRDLFEEIVTSVVAAVERSAKDREKAVPVTIKMRIGIDDDHVTYLDAAQIAQDAGVSAIGLHARTQEQHYSGRARWDAIARLKESVAVPVFGNGDVFSGADAVEMMSQTGCDAVVVGRGCQGRPWLFSELVAATWGLPVPLYPSLGEVCQTLLRHAKGMIEAEGNENTAMREMRKHVGWYLRGFAAGGRARRDLHLVSSFSDLEELLATLDQDQEFPEVALGARGRAGTPKKPHLPHGWLESQTLTAAERENLDDTDDGGSGG